MSKLDQEKLSEQYDIYAEKFREFYISGKDRGKGAMSAAMEKARAELHTLGEITANQSRSMKTYLSRDLEQAISDAKAFGNTLSEDAKDKLQPSRLKAGALSSLAYVLEHTNEALHTLKDKTIDAITYKTGEITSAGSLTCLDCGFKMHLTKTSHIPPCPKCSKTLFHKGY